MVGDVSTGMAVRLSGRTVTVVEGAVGLESFNFPTPTLEPGGEFDGIGGRTSERTSSADAPQLSSDWGRFGESRKLVIAKYRKLRDSLTSSDCDSFSCKGIDHSERKNKPPIRLTIAALNQVASKPNSKATGSGS